jgi:hypothetical protein
LLEQTAYSAAFNSKYFQRFAADCAADNNQKFFFPTLKLFYLLGSPADYSIREALCDFPLEPQRIPKTHKRLDGGEQKKAGAPSADQALLSAS